MTMEVKTVQDKVIVGLSVAVVSLVSIFAGMLISNHFNKDKSNLDAKLEVNQPVENDKQSAVNQTVKEANKQVENDKQPAVNQTATKPILNDKEKKELQEVDEELIKASGILGWRFSNDELSKIYDGMVEKLNQKYSSNVVSVIRNKKDDVLQKIEKDKKEIGSERLKQQFIEKAANMIAVIKGVREAASRGELSSEFDQTINGFKSKGFFEVADAFETVKDELIEKVEEKLKN